MYWLTGSQTFQMMQPFSESLAGRVAIFAMAGLSNAEAEGRPASLFKADIDSLKTRFSESTAKDVHELYTRIFSGSMPRLIADGVDRNQTI